MSKESVTVAGIDCGTNSIRLKIARVDADGMHEVVPRILRVIRLGQDVDKTHRFADEALERAYTAAREFAGVIAEHPIDGLRFVATSATRDAENREEFEDEIERILGMHPEVIPGTEEADLSFLGATSVVNRRVHRAGHRWRRRQCAHYPGSGRVFHEHRFRAHDRTSSDQ